MRFSEFFYAWLYGPRGYYASFKDIGKSGDFFTAVSATPLFGGAIARYIWRRIRDGKLSRRATIVEIGAHRGYLLADIVQFLYTFDPTLIDTLRFTIIEPFGNLQSIQKEYFRQSFGERVKLRHYKDLSQAHFDEAFVVANEIFDAFPCELVFKGQMAYVEDFVVHWGEMDADIAAHCERYGIQKGEVALGYRSFAAKLYAACERCEFVSFDYGDLEPRNDFSIRIYAKHRVFPFFEEGLDIASLFGRSDITYDVHFGHLIDSFTAVGFAKNAYATQLKALVEFGITELLETILEKAGFEAYKRELEKVKILIAPDQMGERFKMVHFTKNIDG